VPPWQRTATKKTATMTLVLLSMVGTLS